MLFHLIMAIFLFSGVSSGWHLTIEIKASANTCKHNDNMQATFCGVDCNMELCVGVEGGPNG